MRYRHEIKYVVDLYKVDDFFKEIAPFCRFDEHADDTHSYEIASIYYDTRDLRFYTDREESVGYRRKIRLRSYNKDRQSVALFIEIKEKHRQLVAKKRINLKDRQILDLGIPHHELPLGMVIDKLEDTEAAREMAYLHDRLDLFPVVNVRYVRKAYIPITEFDMRITLDTRITAGGHSLPIYDKESEKFLLDPAKGVLEIKTNSSIPLWLFSVLKRYDFVHHRFSKYCLGVNAVYGVSRPWLPFAEKASEIERRFESLSKSLAV